MPNASGISVTQAQTLLNGADLTALTYLVSVSGVPTPPARNFGWLYVWTFDNASPFRCYLVESRRIYAPGIAAKMTFPKYTANFRFRFDALWLAAGTSWVIQAD